MKKLLIKEPHIILDFLRNKKERKDGIMRGADMGTWFSKCAELLEQNGKGVAVQKHTIYPNTPAECVKHLICLGDGNTLVKPYYFGFENQHNMVGV